MQPSSAALVAAVILAFPVPPSRAQTCTVGEATAAFTRSGGLVTVIPRLTRQLERGA